jgi:hypothetical protein
MTLPRAKISRDKKNTTECRLFYNSSFIPSITTDSSTSGSRTKESFRDVIMGIMDSNPRIISNATITIRTKPIFNITIIFPPFYYFITKINNTTKDQLVKNSGFHSFALLRLWNPQSATVSFG